MEHYYSNPLSILCETIEEEEKGGQGVKGKEAVAIQGSESESLVKVKLSHHHLEGIRMLPSFQA